MKKLSDSLEAQGINVDIDGEFFKKALEGAGFVDVTVTCHKYALGPWPKDKKLKRGGRIMAEILKTGFEAYGVAAVCTPEGVGGRTWWRKFADRFGGIDDRDGRFGGGGEAYLL